MNTSKFAYKERRIVLRTWLFRKRSSWSVVINIPIANLDCISARPDTVCYVSARYICRVAALKFVIVSFRLSFCLLYVRMSVCVSLFSRMFLKEKSDKIKLISVCRS